MRALRKTGAVMKSKLIIRSFSSVGIILIAGLPASILAQESLDSFSEIVVTATKRAENLQDVGIAINAYTGERLELSAVQNSQDLQIIDPSLTFTTNTAFGQPYLRGVGSELFTPGAESSVAIFENEVYLSRTVSTFQDFFDIEQVTILKGPQGVLFGRNAVGGVINITTKKPTDEQEAKLQLSYGNFNNFRVDGVVNTPLLKNKGRLRLAGLYNNRNGFTRNVETGNDLDDANNLALRGTLDLDISDLSLIHI